MSKVISKSSRKFAKSLFAVCDQGEYQSVAESLAALSEAWNQNPELATFFANPAVKIDQKKSLILELSGAINNEKLINTLLILIDSSKLHLIPEVAAEFSARYQNYLESIQLEITTATAVSEEERQEMTAMLKQSFGAELTTEWLVDEALIGGFTVKSGDSLLDSSISGRLQNFKASLLQ